MANVIYSQVKDFDKNIDVIIKKLNKKTTKLLKDFDFTANNLDFSNSNLNKALAMRNQFKAALKESGYYKAAEKFTDETENVKKYLALLEKENPSLFAFTKSDAKVIDGMQKVDLGQLGMIGDDAADVLSRQMIESVMTGQSWDRALDTLKLKLNNNLGNYAKTYLETSKQLLIQKINDLNAESYEGEVFWLYTGPDDSKTREQCQRGLQRKYFTDTEKQNFEAEGIRYNCRHVFMQVTEEEYFKNASK